MFLHAGWLHIGGNMLFLWIFGNNVEDRLGHVKYALFYLAAGSRPRSASWPSVRTPSSRTWAHPARSPASWARTW